MKSFWLRSKTKGKKKKKKNKEQDLHHALRILNNLMARGMLKVQLHMIVLTCWHRGYCSQWLARRIATPGYGVSMPRFFSSFDIIMRRNIHRYVKLSSGRDYITINSIRLLQCTFVSLVVPNHSIWMWECSQSLRKCCDRGGIQPPMFFRQPTVATRYVSVGC